MVHNLISRTPIVREDELELFSKYGLEYKFVDSLCCSIFPNEEHLILYSDLDKTCEQIAKFSERDAETYREFVNYFLKLSGAAAAGTAGAIPAYGPMMNVLAMSPEGARVHPCDGTPLRSRSWKSGSRARKCVSRLRAGAPR